MYEPDVMVLTSNLNFSAPLKFVFIVNILKATLIC